MVKENCTQGGRRAGGDFWKPAHKGEGEGDLFLFFFHVTRGENTHEEWLRVNMMMLMEYSSNKEHPRGNYVYISGKK